VVLHEIASFVPPFSGKSPAVFRGTLFFTMPLLDFS